MTRRALRPTGKDLRRMNASFSAPVLGWNTRDSFVSMDPRFARVLDNMVVDGGKVCSRKGFTKAAAADFLPEALAAYDWGGSKKLFACGDNKIWTLDTATHTLVQAGSGYLNNRWKNIFYKGRLYFLNGQDAVQVYDGESVQAAQFTREENEAQTPLDTALFTGGCLYRNRLFFIERESLTFWYTKDAGAVQGELLEFDLAQLSRLGGHLVCAAAWTHSGLGAQESQLIFITSEGEVFVYAGDNPSEADSWALRGTYKIPRPVGDKCVCAVGGDVAYLGEDGYYMLSQLLSAPAAQKTAAFSDAINPTLAELKNSFGNYGWTVRAYQPDGLLIVNVPQTGAQTVQHVMNLQNGAWSRFTGINALDWAELDGKLYFCGSGGVYQAQTGQNDDGKSISWRFMGAYGNLGSPYAKILKEVQLYYQGQNDMRFNVNVSVDFKKEYTAYQSNPAAPQSRWDTSPWDTTLWAAEAAAVKKRMIVRMSQGTYFSFGVSGALLDMDAKILGYDVFFERSKNLA